MYDKEEKLYCRYIKQEKMNMIKQDNKMYKNARRCKIKEKDV